MVSCILLEHSGKCFEGTSKRLKLVIHETELERPPPWGKGLSLPCLVPGGNPPKPCLYQEDGIQYNSSKGHQDNKTPLHCPQGRFALPSLLCITRMGKILRNPGQPRQYIANMCCSNVTLKPGPDFNHMQSIYSLALESWNDIKGSHPLRKVQFF